MSRIEEKFRILKQKGRKGFVAYLTAGDPDIEATVRYVLRLEQAGVDIVELGVPFSDPLADGRTNQEAAERALRSGTTFATVLSGVEKIRRSSQIPIVLYSYLNPLLAHGFEESLKRMAAAGVDGLLVLDLTAEESAPYRPSFRATGIDRICLVTPTSTDERIRSIVRHASGFVYCVSRAGVTGAQQQVSADAHDVLTRTRRFTKVPLALGFGISTPEQAREAAADADAVVVGSALVQRLHDSLGDAARFEREMEWVAAMAGAAHGTFA